jgi:hypothetical protein
MGFVFHSHGMTGIDEVYKTLQLFGNGIKIGVIDSGVDYHVGFSPSSSCPVSSNRAEESSSYRYEYKHDHSLITFLASQRSEVALDQDARSHTEQTL